MLPLMLTFEISSKDALLIYEKEHLASSQCWICPRIWSHNFRNMETFICSTRLTTEDGSAVIIKITCHPTITGCKKGLMKKGMAFRKMQIVNAKNGRLKSNNEEDVNGQEEDILNVALLQSLTLIARDITMIHFFTLKPDYMI